MFDPHNQINTGHIHLTIPNISYPQIYQDAIDLCAAGLQDLGYATSFEVNVFKPECINLIFASWGVISQYSQKELWRAIKQYPKQTILLNLEQSCPGGVFDRRLIALMQSCFNMDYYDAHLQEVAHLGIAGCGIEFLYHSILKKGVQTLTFAQKTIDILFFGSITPRRQQLIEQFNQHSQYKITIAAPNCFGEDLKQIIAHSKIVLNLNGNKPIAFEALRCVPTIARGALVISEQQPYQYCYSALKECIDFMELEDLIVRCTQLLSQPEQWQQAYHLQLNQLEQTSIVPSLKQAMQAYHIWSGLTEADSVIVEPSKMSKSYQTLYFNALCEEGEWLYNRQYVQSIETIRFNTGQSRQFTQYADFVCDINKDEYVLQNVSADKKNQTQYMCVETRDWLARVKNPQIFLQKIAKKVASGGYLCFYLPFYLHAKHQHLAYQRLFSQHSVENLLTYLPGFEYSKTSFKTGEAWQVPNDKSLDIFAYNAQIPNAIEYIFFEFRKK